MKNRQDNEQQTDIFTIFAKAIVTDGQSDNDIKARNMDKYEFKKTMTKWDVFGLMMRYLSVSAVTVALVALCIGLSWWPEMEWIIIAVIVVAGALLPITLLFLCYYIYSLFKSARPKSRHDRILLCLHAVDVVLIVTAVFLYYNTKQHCDAFVMEDCYLENRDEMRRIIKEVKTWVPDNVPVEIVYENDGSLDAFASSYNTINFNNYDHQHGRLADEELIKIGADTFLRVGTCGGMNMGVLPGDVVIVNGAIKGGGTMDNYIPKEFPCVPNADVLEAMIEGGRKIKTKSHVGVVQCKDAFYAQHAPESMAVDKELLYKWDSYIKAGCLASEMESATLFAVGASKNVRTGAAMLVLHNQERVKNNINDPKDYTGEEAIDLIIESIKVLIEKDNKR